MKNSKVFGYARVSTRHQQLERQITNILSVYPDAEIVTEKFTGTKIDRPAWNRLYKRLSAGDTVVFDEVSRMSRNAEEGFTVYQELYNRGVNMVFLKEPGINSEVYRTAAQRRIEATVTTGNNAVDTFTSTLFEAINTLLMDLARQQIAAAFDQAQAEVDHLHKRVSEGMRESGAGEKIAEARTGKTFETKKSKEMKEKIAQMSKDFQGVMTDKAIIETLGLARNTYYKYKRELMGE